MKDKFPLNFRCRLFRFIFINDWICYLLNIDPKENKKNYEKKI